MGKDGLMYFTGSVAQIRSSLHFANPLFNTSHLREIIYNFLYYRDSVFGKSKSLAIIRDRYSLVLRSWTSLFTLYLSQQYSQIHSLWCTDNRMVTTCLVHRTWRAIITHGPSEQKPSICACGLVCPLKLPSSTKRAAGSDSACFFSLGREWRMTDGKDPSLQEPQLIHRPVCGKFTMICVKWWNENIL